MKFRLKKIQHHQSLLPEILSYLPYFDRAHLLYTSSRSSRYYFKAHLMLLTYIDEPILKIGDITIQAPFFSYQFEQIPHEYVTTSVAEHVQKGNPGEFCIVSTSD